MSEVFIVELYFSNDCTITRAFNNAQDAQSCIERYENNTLRENDKTFPHFEHCDFYRLIVE